MSVEAVRAESAKSPDAADGGMQKSFEPVVSPNSVIVDHSDDADHPADHLLKRWRKNPSKALAVEDDEILERRHPTRFWAGWDPSLDPLVGYSYVTDPRIPAMPAET